MYIYLYVYIYICVHVYSFKVQYDRSSDTFTGSHRAEVAGSFRASASIGCDKRL